MKFSLMNDFKCNKCGCLKRERYYSNGMFKKSLDGGKKNCKHDWFLIKVNTLFEKVSKYEKTIKKW